MPKPIAEEVRFQATELRLADGERGATVTGLAAPYGTWTPIRGEYLERITADTFARSIRENPTKVPLLTLHDHKEFPVGKSTGFEHTDAGLVGTWQMDTSERAVEVTRLMREGMITGLSVGFHPDGDADEVVTDGDGVTRVTRSNARLLEVSAVSVPASAEAQILAVRSAGLPEPVPVRSEVDALRAAHAAWRAKHGDLLS